MFENYISTLKKFKTNQKTAFIATIIIGFATHLYKFTNYLPNNDSVYNLYAKQDIIQSGRWFLAIPAGLSSDFDLPMITGILSVLYIALAVIVLVSLFNIQNKFVICIVSGITVAYPSITAIFFYGYTSDAYMLALLFAVIAVYLARFGEKKIWKLALSALLVCLTCAIYQAFIQYYLILIIIYFVYYVFTSDISLKQAWLYIAKQIAIFTVGMGAYYFIWKIILHFSDYEAGSYLGLDSLKISISTIISGFCRGLKELLYFITESNLSRSKITFYCAANLLLIGTLCFAILIAAIKSKLYKKVGLLLTVIGALLISLPCTVMWDMVGEKGIATSRTLICTSLFFVLTVLLIEYYFDIHIKNIFGVFAILVIFNYSVMANVGYFTLNRTAMSSVYKASKIMTTIHKYENEYDINRIAFIGEGSYEYPIINNDSVYRNRTNYYEKYRLLTFYGDLLFDNSHAYYYLTNYCGMDLEYVDRNDLLALQEEKQVQALAVWPSSDSFTVIDDILVVKLSDNTNYWWLDE